MIKYGTQVGRNNATSYSGAQGSSYREALPENVPHRTSTPRSGHMANSWTSGIDRSRPPTAVVANGSNTHLQKAPPELRFLPVIGIIKNRLVSRDKAF